MEFTLNLYHNLPNFSQSIIASLRGYYLKWWRYGKETERLVGEALERDFWSEEQWRKWQQERLSYILHRAATRVPFYRQSWTERRRKGDKSSWEYLENWKILEKRMLRTNTEAFVADDCRISRMYHSHTSGTTGTSINLWLSHNCVKQWYALFEARWRRWYGISRHDRWAILGGQLVASVKRRNPPFWVWNAGLNQLYMSSYHLSPELTKYYLEALKKHCIKYIWGYSSALYSLAREIIRQKATDIQMEVVITNAEPLFDYQREIIKAAFRSPVRETYGMAEMVAAASECNQNRLHQWLDAGIIEPEAGEDNFTDFICTGLVNEDMPLIRYRVGDCGVLSNEYCSCGKTLPLIKKIEGRRDDILYTAEGRQIGRLDPVFKNDLPIIEAQLIQQSLEKILLRYVPEYNFNQQSKNELLKRIRERLGNVEVIFEEVAQIPRSSNGKFRAVICNLPAEQRSVFNQYN